MVVKLNQYQQLTLLYHRLLLLNFDILSIIKIKKVEGILEKNSVHFDLLGETTDKEIIINDELTFTVDKVAEFYKGWMYKYMS